MTENDFRAALNEICARLTAEARSIGFGSAKEFEMRVRALATELVKSSKIEVDQSPPAQGFPDIAVGRFGIEVKFTTNDSWLSIANSVLESNRV